MFGVSALLAFLQLGLMLAFMPRSPRWLMTQKRRAEARDVLLNIRNSQVRIFCFTERPKICFNGVDTGERIRPVFLGPPTV